MKFLKLFTVLTSIFSIATLTAQDEVVNAPEMISVFKSAHGSTNASFGASVFFVNPKRVVDGTVYLFDNWDNRGVIYTTGHEKLAINNINLNIQRNAFEAKVGNDSLFSFSFNNIEKFVVNNRVFKNYYWDNDNRVYEEIAIQKDFEILKGFNVKFVEGSSNPMLNRKNDKYIRNESYYVRKDGKITFLALKKSRILKLLDLNDQQKEKLLDYVDQNKLSFKNEDDLKKILNYATKV